MEGFMEITSHTSGICFSKSYINKYTEYFITFIYLTLRYIIKNTDSYNDVYKFVRSAERLNNDASVKIELSLCNKS